MREHLAKNKMTARRLAEEMEVSPGLVSQIMWGKTRVPRRRLEAIAEVLGLTAEQTEELRRAFDAIRAPMMGSRPDTAGWGGARRSMERELIGAAQTFHKEISAQLRQARCLFETDVEYGAMRVDFLVAVGPNRHVALLLRHNPGIDKRELADMPGMVRQYFPAAVAVVIVFPYLTEVLLEMRHLVEDAFGQLATPMNLCLVLHGIIEDFDEGLAFRQGELLRHLAGPPETPEPADSVRETKAKMKKPPSKKRARRKP